MKVKSESEVAQSCPTRREPMDCSPPGSSIHGIFQARVLEWGAIAFSEESCNDTIIKLYPLLPIQCHFQCYVVVKSHGVATFLRLCRATQYFPKFKRKVHSSNLPKVDPWLCTQSLTAAAAAAKSLQSCPTLCNPIDGSPPGSPIPGILQARTLSRLPFPSPMQASEK